MLDNIQVGQIYQHYKNKKHYRILTIAINAENDDCQKMIVYQGMYEDPQFGSHPIFVRSVFQFCEKVLVNGQLVERFQLAKIPQDYLREKVDEL